MASSADYRRRTTLTTGGCAIVALLAFAVVNYARGTFAGIALDLGSAAVVGVALFLGTRTGRFDLVGLVGVVVILTVVVALGVQGLLHAYFWAFPLPIVAFFLLGARRGLVASAASFAVVAVVLLVFPPHDLIRWVEASILTSLALVIAFSWITERQRADYERRLETLAVVDDLTGVFNRRKLEEVLAAELARHARYGRPVSLILFDIDHFKDVNDRLGHAGGDAVLRKVAGVTQATTRSTDLVARLGGDEFAVVASETPLHRDDGAGAQILAERLRRAVERLSFQSRGGLGHKAASLGPTISLGAVEAVAGDDVASLLRRADEALYDAKRSGRNRLGGARAGATPQ